MPNGAKSRRLRLTEKEAWVFCMTVFDSKDISDDGRIRYPFRGHTLFGSGLCGLLQELRVSYQLIDHVTCGLMLGKIRGVLHHYFQCGYLWPINAEGHKQRAAFCRRMIAELEKI